MKTTIRRMGNSHGVLIPKPILTQLGLEDEVDMQVEGNTLVLRRPQSARTGWAEASRSVAAAGSDELVMGEFPNADDAGLVW
jgi:antitoxin MazE